MKSHIPTLEDELVALRHEIDVADIYILDFRKRHLNTRREHAIIFCLARAVDLAKGVLLATEAKLPESVYVSMRGLFEVFIQIYWITQSRENAEQFVQAYRNDLFRNLKSNLINDYARIYDKEAKTDRTQEYLASIEKQKIPLLRFDQMASDTGIEKLYTVLYGFMSMKAHGYTFGASNHLTVEEILDSTIAGASPTLEAINNIASEWIIRRKQLPSNKLYDILGLSQFKP